MKMKKLLAGVLSAAMVATMIPASMAMSSVSAAPEDSLVASYDFTQGETQGWAEYSGLTFTEGDVSQISQGEDGVTFTEEGTYSYSIANPLAGKVTDGFAIAMDVAITGTMNEYNGLLGFNNHEAWNFFEVTTNGVTVRHNNSEGFYDVIDTTTSSGLGAEMKRFVMVANSEKFDIYVDGALVKSLPMSPVASGDVHPDYCINTSNIANTATYFNIGFNCTNGTWQWNNSIMTVSAVSFYNTALSAEDVAALGAYEPPVEDPDAITASVVDVTGEESYEEGDTVSVAVQATGNVDLGGYNFTLKYDNTLLQLDPQEDSTDPNVIVSNDGENGVVVLKVDTNGENSVALGETATTLYTFNFTVKNVAESKDVEFSLTDTMFAYYDDNGIPTEYELVPTLNPCTVSLKSSVVITNPYDFNKDGAADPDVRDVMALAQLIVDQDPMDDPALDYDVHKDEQYPDVVDVLDVMALARIVVNG